LPWIILAAIIWLINLIFIRPSGIKKYWGAGIWSLLLGFFMTEALVIQNDILFSNQVTFMVQGMPVAYLVGLAGFGLIIKCFLPVEKFWKLPYLIFLAAVLTWVEILFINNGYIITNQWSLYYSYLFKLIFLVSVAWLSHLTVREKRGFLF